MTTGALIFALLCFAIGMGVGHVIEREQSIGRRELLEMQLELAEHSVEVWREFYVNEATSQPAHLSELRDIDEEGS